MAFASHFFLEYWHSSVSKKPRGGLMEERRCVACGCQLDRNVLDDSGLCRECEMWMLKLNKEQAFLDL